jgi:hypothetical protein
MFLAGQCEEMVEEVNRVRIELATHTERVASLTQVIYTRLGRSSTWKSELGPTLVRSYFDFS